MTGRLFFDGSRYVVRGELHRGHFSTVYEAYDVERAAHVALKVLSVAGTHRRIAESMFRKEVGALEGLEHPAIVRLLGHFEERDREALVIVLELVPGGRTLHGLIEQAAKGAIAVPPLSWRVEQLVRLLEALNLAHERGVIHRDLKPANVLITEDSHLKLSDFGVARVFESYGRGDGGVTLREFYTRPYAAPEQVLQKDVSSAADLHAFGVLAAAMLHFKLPPPEFDKSAVRKIVEGSLAEDTSAHVAALLEGLLEGDPVRRPRAHEIERVFADLLANTTPKSTVLVRLASSAMQRARELGFSSEMAVLADLSETLRAKYEESEDPTSGGTRASVICFGKNLEVRFVGRREAPDRLIAIGVQRPPQPILARRRQQALPVAVSLALGDGSSDALLEPVHEAFVRAGLEREEREKKEELFAIGSFILEQQRKRLLHLRIRCRLNQAPRGGGGRARGGGQRDEQRGVIKLRIVEVRPWDPDVPAADDLALRWASDLDGNATFRLSGRTIGAFRSFDAANQVLAIGLRQPEALPPDFDLECRDVALETSLARQETALRQLFEDRASNPQLGQLLLHPEQNFVENVDVPALIQPHLSPPDEVRSLVARVLGARDMFLLQGPPGTGKTTMIAEIVSQLLRRWPNSRILLTSQTHEAVDNAFARLEEVATVTDAPWRLVREVSPESRQPGVRSFEESFRGWAARVRERSVRAFEQMKGAMPPERAVAVDAVLTTWRERIDQVQDVRQDFAASVQLIAATCLRVPAVLRRLREESFDWVIVDEAAKATATEVLVPIVTGKRIVLVGDHLQLPPFLDAQTVDELKAVGHSPESARRSLFEALFARAPASNKDTLRVQHRMHRSIGTFVSDLFYRDVGGLETGVKDEHRTLDVARFDSSVRVYWCDVDGAEQRDGTSWWNPAEIAALENLARELGDGSRNPFYDIGVITPYAAQARRLRDRRLEVPGAKVRVATVDAFQGKQVDVVLYSMVREAGDEARFVADPRRLNVAFSRSKRLLIIVGSKRGAERSARFRAALGLIPAANVFKWAARR